MKNPYQVIKSKIEKVVNETPTIKTFVIRPDEQISFLAGQFIQLTVPGIGEAPFTPSSSPEVLDTIEITVMKVGSVTSKLHSLSSGDIVGVRGPYGKSYPIEKFFNREVLIVGGGVGMAPLRSLLFALMSQIGKFKRVILCYGARTPEDIVYKQQFLEWKKVQKLEILRSVDKVNAAEKWTETVGVVTVLLDKVKCDISQSVVIVCGPPIMMKFTTLKLVQQGYKPENIYLSMERNMSCGLGKCGHCAIGPYFVCKDGPVFTYAELKDQPELWA
ncbi:MAG: FAD/NAD(P)-binding protein [Elusimicrobiota bacterium]|nr:FAD/NAD(P)-binding protein [Elusimicrobiota bacterium]